ncbi:MAG TPA: hypothetical protein DD435_07975 [Cyanobacteria bacterium UBA8530]|nr:hypothetical protein [Cyanobacteria bacterium UBA8530]
MEFPSLNFFQRRRHLATKRPAKGNKRLIAFEKVTICITDADDLFFIRQYKVLIDLGFVEVGDFTLPGTLPRGYHRAFAHPEQPVYAMISHLFPRKPEKHLAFLSPLSDGAPLFSDNREIPDDGKRARFLRVPGAGAEELLSLHQKLLKELLAGGLEARPIAREEFFGEYARHLIFATLSLNGTPRHEEVLRELQKLPLFDPRKLLKKSSKKSPSPLSLEKPAEKKEEPAASPILAEMPEKRFEKAEEKPVFLEKTVPSLLKFIPPSEEGEAPLVRFDQIPLDAAVSFPFETPEVTETTVKIDKKPEETVKAEKPSRVKAPDKCPACGEPVLSPLSSYCRKCKAYLR